MSFHRPGGPPPPMPLPPPPPPTPSVDQEIAFNLSVFAVPVIPGPDTLRDAPRPGEPGHLERLVIAAPRGRWPLADRWKAFAR